MSGIVGLYRADRQAVDPSLLGRMSRAIAHRGPDAAGQWVAGPMGLAHRLLYTTPESLDEKQPVADQRGECRLVWDGRLDNRDELIATLRADWSLGGRTDPELALEAYREWGTNFLKRIIGEFAFALWDGRTHTLLCARDRLGLKPFHYTWNGVALGISSEIKPLFDLHGTMPEPDDEMVLAFLLREFREADQGRTFFRGIHRLPPGHFLLLQDGKLQITRYWAIDPAKETHYQRDEEYAEHFLSLFTEAVRCRTRSYFPIAAFLSGGLDSASIVCAAERLFSEGGGSPPFEAFTLFSDDPGTDERQHVHEVIRATATKSHEVYGADRDSMHQLDERLWEVESPILGATRQSGLALTEAALSRACRVILSGEGGDQVIDEIGYLADLLRLMRPVRFLRETLAFADWYGGDSREFAQMALAALLPPSLKFWGKRVTRRVPPPWVNRRLAREVNLADRIREPRHHARFSSRAQAETYLHVTSPYYLLKLEVDERFIARLGAEIRYPFLDSRLVEFVLSIPWARRTRNGERKRILRSSMQGIVPEAIRSRRGKGDWTDSMDDNLAALCRLAPPAPLENRSGRMGRYLDLRRTEEFVARFLRGARDLRWEVWFMITVDRWLNQFWGRSDHE